jgi:hypothetical protein
VQITVEAHPPTVVLTSPTQGALLLANQPIALVVSASDDDGFIVLTEFFSGTAKLGDLTNAPFAFIWTNAPPGQHALRVAVTDNSGNRVFSEEIMVTVAAGFSVDTALVAQGSVWKYFDHGLDLGTAWRDPGFDDSTWAQGPAPLGYGDGDESTVVGFGPDANNKYITTYFRTAFNLLDTDAVTLLGLDILRDDGAVVYLNGSEAFRTGMPEGPVTFGTLANIVVVGGDESTNFFPGILDPILLVEGENTLAVEIHQRGATSSDISFDLKLQAVQTFFAPTILVPPTSQSVNVGSNAIFSVSASGTSPLYYQWQHNGLPLPGQNSDVLVLEDTQLAHGGYYSVLVTNVAGAALSDEAVLAVTMVGDYSTTVLADGPIHYYRFEEANLLDPAIDLGTPGGFDGTYTGGLLLDQSTAPLPLGSAARFGGAPGTFVDLGRFHPGPAITVEAWIRLDHDARGNSYHAIVARWDGSFELDIDTSDRPNLVIRNQANTFGLVAGPEAIVRDQWHHLAGIYDSGIMILYVNGHPVASVPQPGTLRDGGPSPDRVLIGGTRDGFNSSFNWKGLIDEVAIYNRALPEHRILAHYQAGLPEARLTIDAARVLSWPAFPPHYVLQVTERLDPPVQWRDDLSPRHETNGFFKVTIETGERSLFYRLRIQ